MLREEQFEAIAAVCGGGLRYSEKDQTLHVVFRFEGVVDSCVAPETGCAKLRAGLTAGGIGSAELFTFSISQSFKDEERS
jgi:hypothetical protein